MNVLRTFVMVAVCGAMALYSTDAFARKVSSAPGKVNTGGVKPGSVNVGWVYPPAPKVEKGPDGGPPTVKEPKQPEERGYFGRLADKQKAKQKPQ